MGGISYIQIIACMWVSSVGLSLPDLGHSGGAPRGRCPVDAVESPSSLSLPSADGIYEIGGLFPVWGIVLIAGTALAAVTFFATSNSKPPRFHWVRILGSPRMGWGWGPWDGDLEVFQTDVLSVPRGGVRPVITFCNDGSSKPLSRVIVALQGPLLLLFLW